MLQLDNRTPYEAERAVLLDLDGSEIWVVVVQATFEIRDGRTSIADVQEPVRLIDEYYGDPGTSSLKYECDLVFRKPGTDVVINGHACAPSGRPTSKLDVVVRVAGNEKTIRVRGDRQWQGSTAGLSISAARPFVTMPFSYERAFGGTDLFSDNPDEHGAEYRNPIGTGFATSTAHLNGRPLPNFEDPADEITAWNSRPQPVGLGFRGKHWQPRCRFAGTCDQAYIETRLPLYPLDFDPRFFLGASRELVFSPHLRGGEPVALRNMTADGFLEFELPRVTLGFSTRLEGRWVDHHATLGTVVIEPDVPRLTMTWQTFLPCHRKTFDLDVTRIIEKRRL